MAEIGLVTVLFGSDDVLTGFIQSLSKQSFKNYHLYLIDNQNSDKTESLVDSLVSEYPISTYSYIKNVNNEGVAKANNQGITLSMQSNLKYTILLNNDIEFDQPDLLSEMYQMAENGNEPIIIPKIFYYDSGKIWMAGGDIDEYKGITKHIGQDCDDGFQFNKPMHFNYAPTCFMLIKNTVFEEVGIMDESYFVYYDDVDFLYRANKKGYKVFYMPNLVVRHKVSSSTGGGDSVFTIFYNHRNRIYFILSYTNWVKKGIALGYTFASRLIKYISYNNDQRKALVNGLVTGFKLHNSKLINAGQKSSV